MGGVAAALPIGTRIGAYELGEMLGSGGFGCVYRARHTKIATEVAIKILHADRCLDASSVSRFLDEARTVNTIRHPGIVEVFDFGTTEDNTHYFVMELLRGRSLAAVLDERGALPVGEALPILRAIAEVVDAVHAAGASHRDLKPANVMLLDDGRVKLIDFGLAKLAQSVDRTATTEAFGTPQYMAPEQCRGVRADAAADRYAFGALSYHLLTGQPPFSGDALAVAIAHVETPAKRPSRVRPGLSPAIDDVVLALLAKDPDTRPFPLVTQVAAMRARRRVRWPWLAAPIAAAGSVVAYVALTSSEARPIDPARVREIRVVPADIGNMFSMRPDGSVIRFMTTDLGRVASLPWGGEVDTSREDGVYISMFPDGRKLVGGPPTSVRLVDGATTTMLGGNDWPEACADNRSAAMFVNGRLVVHDVVTGETRDAVTALGAWGVRWSPSCSQLVWGNHEGVHLTDLVANTTRTLPIAVVGPLRFYQPAAFLSDDTLVYCGRDPDTSVVLRAHYLDGREPDTRLATMDGPGITRCTIATSSDGSRVAVATEEQETEIAIYDLASGTRTVVDTDPTGAARAFAFVDEDHVVVATPPVATSWLQEPPMEAPATPAVRLAVATAGAKPTPEVQCPGSIGLARFRDRLVHVVLEARSTGYRMLARTTCEQLARFPLPGNGPASFPSCAGERCIAARLTNDQIVVYELGTGREIARLPHFPGMRDTAPYALVALSPDGNRAIVTRRGDAFYHRLTIADGTFTSVEFGWDLPVHFIRWIDANTFLLHLDGGQGRVDLVTYDGVSSTVLPDSGVLQAISPSGKKIALALGKPRRKFHLFEIAP